MVWHYPEDCEITERRGNTITDKETANDDGGNTSRNYDSADNASETSDPTSYTTNSISPANNYISDLDDDDSTIVLSPSGVD